MLGSPKSVLHLQVFFCFFSCLSLIFHPFSSFTFVLAVVLICAITFGFFLYYFCFVCLLYFTVPLCHHSHPHPSFHLLPSCFLLLSISPLTHLHHSYRPAFPQTGYNVTLRPDELQSYYLALPTSCQNILLQCDTCPAHSQLHLQLIAPARRKPCACAVKFNSATLFCLLTGSRSRLKCPFPRFSSHLYHNLIPIYKYYVLPSTYSSLHNMFAFLLYSKRFFLTPLPIMSPDDVFYEKVVFVHLFAITTFLFIYIVVHLDLFQGPAPRNIRIILLIIPICS